jgi:hypothetical protein
MWRHVGACKGPVPEGVVAPLLLALGNDNPHVVVYCERTLSVLGERVRPQLQAIPDAGWSRPRRLAALEGARRLLAIEASREPASTLLWALLADTDGIVRDRAFALLKLARSEDLLLPLRDVRLVLPLLSAEQERVRAAAVAQLEQFDEAAFPVLLKVLDERDARADALRALQRLLERGLEPPADLTLKLLRKVEPESRLQATLDRLVQDQTPVPQATVDQVNAAIAQASEPGGNTDGPYRFFTGPGNTAHVARVLEAHLVDPNPKVQASAAWALHLIYAAGRKPTQKALANLATPLRSPDREARQYAVSALRDGLKPPLKVPAVLLDALREIVTEDFMRLRQECTEFLAACGPQAEKTLLVLLHHPNANVQVQAARAVQRMASEYRLAARGTEPALVQLLDSGHYEVRWMADAALLALKSIPRGDWP